MVRRQKSTVRDLRRGNQASLLRMLYFDGPLSRRELSRATGLSAATVSNVIRDLVAAKIVTEVGQVESDGGRRQILLSVDPSHGYAVGVDVGETRVQVELFDLSMTVRARADFTMDPHRPEPSLVTRLILEGLAVVLAEAKVDERSVLGVGVGVPGIVEQEPQVLVHAKTLGWEAVPLAALLAEGTTLPVFADNGAKTMGQAELWFGAGRGARHAVVSLIGTGVGASIITDGATYRGATSSAGEWGHTMVALGGRTCRCGARGCLEAYVGARAILERYQDAAARSGVGETEEAALAELLLAADTSQTARAVLDETIAYLGGGLANLINLFNPTHVILGGWVGLQLAQRHLPAIVAATAEHALPLPFAQASIVAGQLGPDAVALGAATLVLEHFLDNSSGRPDALQRDSSHVLTGANLASRTAAHEVPATATPLQPVPRARA